MDTSLNARAGYYYQEKKERETKERIAALEARVKELEDALKPFSHKDLNKYVSGQGLPESVVFQRDNAILRIRDFQNASKALK